jgi:signal transduction histidine kinase
VRAEFSRTFLVSLDGRRRKFILTVLPIPEFRNEQFGAVAILYDVTDFARLDELRTELIAVASHELKAPLTTLRMNLLLPGERAENLTARQHEILATAVLGCHELASTIDELLDLTRIEAGQLRLTRDSVDLYAVIDRAVASLSQRFEDAEVKLHVGGNGKPAFLLGDPARLAMVFTNLLSNALKYTPQDLDAAREDLESIRIQTAGQVTTVYRQILRSRETALLYRNTLIPLAHQAFQVMLVAYQSGKTDFTTLISTFRQQSDARSAYLQAVNQLLAQKVALEQACGGSLQ